ncbi:MAG: hypothetical protein KY455_07220 [Euryarchaeota archaeon]|nr:hypothetical protein [Euryarchaeota archaeon]
MELRRPLHLATLLLAIFGVAWLLMIVVPALTALFIVILVLPLVAFVALFLWQRTLEGPEKTMALAGSVVAIGWYAAVFVLLFLASPITFKGEPGERGLNEAPPEIVQTFSDTMAALLPVMVAVTAVVTLWPVLATRERALGAVGAAILVLGAGLPLVGVALGTAYAGIVFGLGLLAWSLAMLLPLVHPDGTTEAWA